MSNATEPAANARSREESREIRVFLSSTFKDMDAERDYLIRSVFPEIRQICLDRLVSFSEIDLRWGVTEEEAKNGRTVEICLEEIDRCRKTGTPPFFIGFLGERYGWIPQHSDLESYWQRHADSKYAPKIREALERGVSVTELEMRAGFLDATEGQTRVQTYLRAPEFTASLLRDAQRADPSVQESDFIEHQDNQDALKSRLRGTCHVGIDGYDTKEQFGEAVKHFLLAEIDRLFPAADTPGAYDKRKLAHDIYAASRRKAYVPSPDFKHRILEGIRGSMAQAGSKPIQIIAESGMGKSAFLADLQPQIGEANFIHFVGADGDRTLGNWLDRIFSFLEVQVDDIPADDRQRLRALPFHLAKAGSQSKKSLVLLLDAIDQLDEPQSAVEMLESLELPEGAALVLSSTPGYRLDGSCLFELPPFDEKRRRQAIDGYLSGVDDEGFRKRLSNDLIDTIVRAPPCESPLFLRLVLERLRVYARFETLADETGHLLGVGGAGRLFLDTLTAMDGDYAARSNSADVATRSARMIAASRAGLDYWELKGLLAPEGARGLRADVLAPLQARLNPFCLLDDGRVRVMHDLLLKAIKQDRNAMEAARRSLLAYFSGDDGSALAQRLYQHWCLGDIKSATRILCDVDSMIRLWKADPGLLKMFIAATMEPSHSDMQENGSKSSNHGRESFPLGLKRNESTLEPEIPEELEALGQWMLDNYLLQTGRTLIDAWCNPVAIIGYRAADRRQLVAIKQLASAFCIALGDVIEAEAYLRDAIHLACGVGPIDDDKIDSVSYDQADIVAERGKMQEAKFLLYPLEEKWWRPPVGINLAEIDARSGVYLHDAKDRCLDVLSQLDETTCPDDRVYGAACHYVLGLAYLELAELDKANASAELQFKVIRSVCPREHHYTARAMDLCSRVDLATGDTGAAEVKARKAIDIYNRVFPLGNIEKSRANVTLAEVQWRRGDAGAANEALRGALNGLTGSVHGPGRVVQHSPDVARALILQATMLMDFPDQLDHIKRARIALNNVIEWLSAPGDPGRSTWTARARFKLAELEIESGNPDQANVQIEDAVFACDFLGLSEAHPLRATAEKLRGLAAR